MSMDFFVPTCCKYMYIYIRKVPYDYMHMYHHLNTFFGCLVIERFLFQLPVSIHVLDVFGRTSVRMTCGGFYVLVETGNMPINIQKPSQLSGSFGRSYGGSAKMRGSFKNRLGISNYQHI